MTAERNLPSPLAGEGAARRRRGAGEGADHLKRTKNPKVEAYPSPGSNSLRSFSPSSPAGGEGKSRARRLRQSMTDAERKLWFALKDRRFAAFKFRRQVPIEHYVADFLCFEARLVLEVDGGQHAGSTSDAERDAWFRQNDFRILRFWNNDVLSNLEGVLEHIRAELNLTPHPASRVRSMPPSPAGGEGKNEKIAR